MTVATTVFGIGRSRRRANSFARLASPVVLILAAVLVTVVVVSIIAPSITPYDPNATNLADKYLPVSAEHLLGTDALGRDLFSRLLVGGRTCLITALAVVLLSVVVGVPLGLLAAAKGGWFDAILMRVYDVVLAFPSLLLAIVLVAAFGSNAVTASIAVGITYVPMISRLTRSLVSVELSKPYVLAARSLGYGEARILLREVLPNCVPTLLSELTLDFGYAIIALTSLSYLGLGVQPPQSDWGTMIQDGMAVVQLNPLPVLAPAIAVVLVIVALNLLNDSVQSRVDDAEADGQTLPKGSRGVKPLEGRHGSADDVRNIQNADVAQDSLLRIEDLTVAVGATGAPREIVKHASLNVRPGTIVGIVGESGSGKSTLISSVLRLHDERRFGYVSGRILFEGRDVLAMNERELNRLRGSEISMIFQNPGAVLNPVLTIGRQLEEKIHYKEGLKGAEAKKRALELLEQLHVVPAAERFNQYPHELSGGLLQRVMIASALVGKPKLLLADEPTTALDVTVQAQVLGILKHLRDDLGIAIVIVTHNFGVVAEICDEVHVIHEGEIVESASVGELFDRPQQAYTRQLLAARLTPGEGEETGQKNSAVASDEVVVSVDGVSKRYGDAHHVTTAVDDVDLEVHRGSIFGLVGESGSGKTTIGNCVLGFIKPSEGSVRVEGVEVSSIRGAKALRKYRGDVQMVFQNPYLSFNPRKTLRKQFDEYAAFLGLNRAQGQRLVRERLDSVSIDERLLDQRPSNLSGGQLQRLAIARALMPNPTVLFADEPVSALDVCVQKDILNLLARLRDERGLTIVLVSHDLGVVETICDQVAVMSAGHVVERGRADRVFHHPQHEYTRRLLAARPKERP